jgi:tRNA U38,U39,U40 pseudouridine synthase TruA
MILSSEIYTIEIKGEKFLRYMIRRMVGAAVKIATDETLSIDLIGQTLAKKRSKP